MIVLQFQGPIGEVVQELQTEVVVVVVHAVVPESCCAHKYIRPITYNTYKLDSNRLTGGPKITPRNIRGTVVSFDHIGGQKDV